MEACAGLFWNRDGGAATPHLLLQVSLRPQIPIAKVFLQAPEGGPE